MCDSVRLLFFFFFLTDDRGKKVRNAVGSIAREVELANLTLTLAAGERGDERCGSRSAHRPFERRETREFQVSCYS